MVDEHKSKIQNIIDLFSVIFPYICLIILLFFLGLFMRHLRISQEKNERSFYEWYKPYQYIQSDYNRKMSELKYSIDEFYMISNTNIEKEKIDKLYENIKIRHNEIQNIANKYNNETSLYRNYVGTLKVPTVDEIHKNSLKDIFGGWYVYYNK